MVQTNAKADISKAKAPLCVMQKETYLFWVTASLPSELPCLNTEDAVCALITSEGKENKKKQTFG